MRVHSQVTIILSLFMAQSMGVLIAQTKYKDSTFTVRVNDSKVMNAMNVVAEEIDYKGKRAIKVLNKSAESYGLTMVQLTNIDFHNGTIETEIAGMPSENASEESRGFTGIAFRISNDNSGYECIYIRPTNGRSDDQIRRNHSLQYVSYPDFPWYKLRKESPEKYESYADLVPGEWTKIKIEVNGSRAKLYVHNNSQPSLIINDLKLGKDAHGAIGFWVGTETAGYFSDMVITRRSGD